MFIPTTDKGLHRSLYNGHLRNTSPSSRSIRISFATTAERKPTAFFDTVPIPARPLVAFVLRRQMRKALWLQGISRHSDKEIMAAAISDWKAVLAAMSDGPYFHGDRPSTIDATLLGVLATTVLTPIQSPIRDFLRSQPKCMTYAERMMRTYFPEMGTRS